MGKKFNDYSIRVVEETMGVNPDLVELDSSISARQPCKAVQEQWYYGIDKKSIEELAKRSLDFNLTILDFAGYDYEFVADEDGDRDHIRSASVVAHKGDYYINWTLTIHKEL